jgi:hypothetical protein
MAATRIEPQQSLEKLGNSTTSIRTEVADFLYQKSRIQFDVGKLITEIIF